MTALNAAILFNNSTGSDTTASGSSAGANVYGSGASTTSASAVVTGITTTGVQAGDLLWVQSSSGRQFSVIASVDSGTQVTCDDTFANTESSRTWAIGGKRATLGGSSQIFADASGGYVLQLEDSHTETITSTLNLSATSNSTNGVMILRGDPTATTKPKISTSSAINLMSVTGDCWKVQNIELEATGSGGVRGIEVNSGGAFIVEDCKFTSWKNYVASTAIRDRHGVGLSVRNCHFYDCKRGVSDAGVLNYVDGCWFDQCEIGWTGGTVSRMCFIRNNVFSGGTSGVSLGLSNDGRDDPWGNVFEGNVFYGQSSSAFVANFNTGGNAPLSHFTLTNNIFGGGGGYAFENTGTATSTSFGVSVIDRNAYYDSGYTSGRTTIASLPETNAITLTDDPFVDSAASDFNIADNAGGGATIRANNFSLNTDTAVYPFRQYVSDAFGGGGGSQFHPLG